MIENELTEGALRGDLEALKRLADTAMADFARMEAENAALRKMVAALQRERTIGSGLISIDEREPSAEDGTILVIWEDGMADLGEYNSDTGVIVTRSERCLDAQTGDEGHSIEWWIPLPAIPGKIESTSAVSCNAYKEAYAVVLKMMDSHS